MAEIRPFETGDADAAAALLSSVFAPPTVIGPTAVLHWADSSPERAQARVWVAHVERRIVGWADAQLKWSSADEGLTEVWAAVDREHRGRGIGRRLSELAEEHALALGARQIRSFAREDEPDSLAFAERRGYREARRERSWCLDLRAAAPQPPADPAGFRVVRLGELRDRVHELFELYALTDADMPSDYEHRLEFDEWRRETWENPELDFELSAAVLAEEHPVAFAWITADRETKQGENEMTGTHPAYRGRGLARLAKEATIAWAAEAGLEYLLTSNDSTNAAMLALNERLGYEPRPATIELAKDV